MAKEQKKHKDENCKDLHRYVYTWVNPELCVLGQWSGYRSFRSIMQNHSTTVKQKIEHISQLIFGNTPTNADMFLFEKKLEGAMSLDRMDNVFIEKDMIIGDLCSIKHSLYKQEFVYVTLPTGRTLHRTTQFQWVVREFIKDLANLHCSDMNKFLEEHYDGKVITQVGTTFEIVTGKPLMSCELEGLLVSSAKFNCNGSIFQMLPVIID